MKTIKLEIREDEFWHIWDALSDKQIKVNTDMVEHAHDLKKTALTRLLKERDVIHALRGKLGQQEEDQDAR